MVILAVVGAGTIGAWVYHHVVVRRLADRVAALEAKKS